MTLTTHAIITEAQRLADENPDFIYRTLANNGPQCLYVHVVPSTGERVGGCLFGQAMMNLGVGASFLEQHEFMPAAKVIEGLGLSVDDDQSMWIGIAQEKQDSGMPWKGATDEADQFIEVKRQP